MKPTRIDRIRAALKKHGPMTSKEISEKTGIRFDDTCKMIAEFRKNPGKKMMIRQVDKIRESCRRLSWVYELSNEPDIDIYAVRPTPKPRLTREEKADLRRCKELASQIRPWRDPLVFLTAGRAP